MFKQAFRFAFVAIIWKQYKAVIVSTTLLFIYLFLVSWVHSDYIASAQLENQTTGLGRSFLVKWAAFGGGLGMYFLFHFVRSRLRRIAPKPPKSVLMPRVDNADATDKIVNDPELAEDPFARIRSRKKLRGRKDF